MSNSSGAQHLLIFLCGVEFLCGMNVSYGMVFLSRAANERDEQLAGGFHRRSDARANIAIREEGMKPMFAILIALVICGTAAALEGVCAGKSVRTFFATLRFPRYSAPLWVWTIIGGVLPHFLLHHLSIVSV